MGRVNKELHKQKPKSNSVKGKKDFARNKAALSIPITDISDRAYPITAASNKKSISNLADWSTNISKLRSEISGEFIFGANPEVNMGDQLGRGGFGDAEGEFRGNPRLHSMDISLPSSADECKPGLLAIDNSGLGIEESSMVEASIHHAAAGSKEQVGSLNALCGIDVGQMPGEDVHMEFDVGSDIPASC